MDLSLAVQLRRFLWSPVRVEAARQVDQWLRSVGRTPEVQERLLKHLVSLGSRTRFGRDHGFDRIRTIDDFRRAVPIAGYQRLAPYIERVKNGEVGALFPRGTRVRMFALTSGTTGTPKHIPVTDAFFKAYRRGWQIWGARAMSDHFDAFGAKILQIVSRMDERMTPSGVPAGAISGLCAQGQRSLVRLLYLVPPESGYAGDTETKYYLASRRALAVRRVVPLTANPSTLLGLARAMDRRKEELVRDVADGTLTPDLDLGPPHRRKFEARLKADPDRAKELERAVEEHGNLYPKDVWQIPLIGTWKGGTLSLYLREMPRYWGDAPTRDIGLVASEGRFSIPIETQGSAGVLEVMGAFVEFVPEDEIDSGDPASVLAHEVEVGGRYYLVPTTPGGLYRYHLGDLVEVVYKFGPAPAFRFLNRGEHVSSVTGEKLTEHQVVTAVNRAIDGAGLGVRCYCLCPTWDTVPYYSLLVEEHEVGKAPARLAASVDAALRGLNIEYESKRASGRLGPVRVKALPRGTWQTFDREALEARGGRPEQYKHKFLTSDVDFDCRFAVCASYQPPSEEVEA
jgi:hypothetical protein